MHVGVEVRQVPEGLHEEDQARAGAGESEGVGLEETARGDAAELAQPRPVAAEERSQEPRDGEDVLPVGHGLEEMFFDPLAVEEYPLLVATRAEVACLTGEGEEIIVAAGVAPDAREPVVRIAALDEALDHLPFDRAPRLSSSMA